MATNSESRRTSRSATGHALLLSWRDDPNSTVTHLSTILTESFGYQVTTAELHLADAEKTVNDHIESILGYEESFQNPLIIYYRGGYLVKQKTPFLKPILDGDRGLVDWVQAQKRLRSCHQDILLLFDCESVRHGHSTLVGALKTLSEKPENLGGKSRKVEALAATVSRDSVCVTSTLINSIKFRASIDAFDFNLVADDVIAKVNGAEYLNLSPSIDTPPIKMHRMQRRDNFLSASNSSRDLLGADMKGMSLLDSTSTVENRPYKKVVVLPIAWASTKESFDPAKELSELANVFKKRFPFIVESIFAIPQTSKAEEIVQQRVKSHLQMLSSEDLFIIMYNGHGGSIPGKSPSLLLAPHIGSNNYVNWTSVSHQLNTADCDTLQILDCCFAATATKGDSNDVQLLSYSNIETTQADFKGRNETLASSGRDRTSWAGEFSSMPLFTTVLESLASENQVFTVDHWYHAIDSQVYLEMAKGGKRWYTTPYRKMNPIVFAQKSIQLWTHQG